MSDNPWDKTRLLIAALCSTTDLEQLYQTNPEFHAWVNMTASSVLPTIVEAMARGARERELARATLYDDMLRRRPARLVIGFDELAAISPEQIANLERSVAPVVGDEEQQGKSDQGNGDGQ